MLLNYTDLFNSHVSHSNKGIHHQHLICILQRSSQVCLLVTPNDIYNSNHIMAFRWTFSSRNAFWKLYHWNTGECHHQLIEHSSGNPAIGTARILTTTECQEWRETETIGGDSTIANRNNRYHVTSWRERSWEKHSDARSNTNGYYKMCQWLQLYSVAMERIMKLQGQQLDLETFAESHLILSTGYWNNHLRKETLILSPPSFDYLSPLLSLCVIHKTAQPREYRDAHFNY